MSDLLDPKNDYVFKRLFAGAPALLAALINAVRRGAPSLTSLEVRNPAIAPADLAGKSIALHLVGHELERNIVELPKADRFGLAPGSLAAWLFFCHWQDPERLSRLTEAPVRCRRAAPWRPCGSVSTNRTPVRFPVDGGCCSIPLNFCSSSCR